MTNFKSMMRLLGLMAITFFIAACSSSSDSGSSTVAPPAADYAGFWVVSGTDTGNCGDEGSWSGSGTITVSGNTMTGFPAGGGVHSGTISGNTLTVSTSYAEGSGTVALNFTATFSSASAVSGNGTWTYTEAGWGSCNGTTTFSGNKI